MNRAATFAVLAALLIAGCTAGKSRSEAARPLNAAIVGTLQQGGWVIYFRHAAVEPSQVDAGEIVVDDCATQQNLSPTGRSQAQAIGAAFLQLRIPVAEVWSSPLCRCVDTARIAFGRVTVDPELLYRREAPGTVQADHRGALIELLSSAPAVGTNTVIVSDRDTFAATVGGDLEEGEAAIIAPERPGHFRLITRVRPDEWTSLVQAINGAGTTGSAAH